MDCFIIMPITTPESFADRYSADPDHFQHVLDLLFVPAVEAADMTPIPPSGQGADIIPAEIIRHIETADFVLCDMSSLNANVFFELGIRTAVNKPVALVKDDVTPHVPFDAHMINHHTYVTSLAGWTIEDEVKKLTEHLSECVKRAEAGNTLWKYFSLSAQAEPLAAEHGVEGQLELVNRQIEALRRDMRDSERHEPRREETTDLDRVMHRVFDAALEENADVVGIAKRHGRLVLILNSPMPSDLESRLNRIAHDGGYPFEVQVRLNRAPDTSSGTG